jgi:hypothetical protein
MGKITMEKQLDLFARGGLEDEGGEVDEVSGNEVPVGGTKKGVRDDIPAMISEGEFIFPEDVVRYIGLDKLMQLRQEAKMGLKKMEAMGQMGNSDEATMPDDLPFDMADLIIVSSAPQENDEPKKMSQGGMGYQPSIYQGTQINPNQYIPPASSFNPATTQQPFQTTSYLPSFAGVPYQTVTGTPRPDTTAEEAIDSIYINVKYINPATGDIRTFKFYEGKPISDIPEGYVPYKEGVDPEDVVKEDVVEEDIVTNVTQVSRDRDDDGAPPPPPPFNWDEATPEAIVNEVNKIKGPAGSVMAGLAFALNPVLGGLTYAATKANEKQTLTKLGEMLKDKNFVKKMSNAGQLKNLRDSLVELQDKTEGKGTVNVDFLGVVGGLIKTVTNALTDVLTPKQKEDAVVVAVTSAANIAPPKRPDQKGEEPTITIVDDPFATSAAAPYFEDNTLTRDGPVYSQPSQDPYAEDRFATPEGLGSTSVLGDTLVLDNRFRPDRVEITPSQIAGVLTNIPEDANAAETDSAISVDPIIAAARRSAKQGAAAFRALQDKPPEEDAADPLSMAQAVMKAMTQSSKEQREQVYDPSLLQDLTETPVVTTPTPATTAPTPAYTQPSQDPYAEAGKPTSSSSDDDGPSAAQIAASAPAYAQPSQDPYAEAGRPTPSTTYSTDTSTAIQQMKDRGTFNVGGRAKGGFISKPKKKVTSKKRGLATRK